MKIAIIGGGKMGEAILGGLLSSAQGPAASLDAGSFVVANPGLAKREHLQATYGVACVERATEIENPDVVVLAVKPQVMPAVLADLAEHAQEWAQTTNPLYISIAAGLTSARLAQMLPQGARIVRTMPNTPLMVGAGMTAVVNNGGASDEDVQFVCELFACLGNALAVREQDMDAVCAVSGSGPAYVAAMIEALRDGGVEQGLEAELAETLALQTVFGTALLIKESGQTPEQTRISVCSPGGTTLAALDAMNAAGFADVFKGGVAAATKRSKELGA